MNIREKIKKELIESQKAKEAEKVQVLRSILASIKNTEIETKDELDKNNLISILRTEVKKRKEAIEQYKQGNREELAKKEQREIEIIDKFLPELMPEEKIEKEVDQVIKEVEASNMSDMGKVMGKVMSKLEGKVEGEKVKNIVQKKLS